MSSKLIIAQILIVFICLQLNCVLGVKKDQKHNTTLEKQSLYDTERDGRQFAGGYSPGFGGDYGLTGFGGPLEAIIIGLCVVAGFGIIGIPFILLFLSFFNGGGLGTTGGIGGLNLVPTTTTTVAGRKRREINSLLPEVNPMLQQKLFNIFDNFIQNPDKIKLIEKVFDTIIGRK